MVDLSTWESSSTDGRRRLLVGAGLLLLAGVILVFDVGGTYALFFVVGSGVLAACILVDEDGRIGIVAGETGGAAGLFLVVSLVGAGSLATVPCLVGSLVLLSGVGRVRGSDTADPSPRLARTAMAGAAIVTLAQIRLFRPRPYVGIVGSLFGETFPPTPGGMLFVVAAPALLVAAWTVWGWTSAHLAIALLAWLPVGAVTGAFVTTGPIPGAGIRSGVSLPSVVMFLAGISLVAAAGLLEIRRQLPVSRGEFSSVPPRTPRRPSRTPPVAGTR